MRKVLKRWCSFFCVVLVMFIHAGLCDAESFSDTLKKPISVQKIIGSDRSYVFAGWVGSMLVFNHKNVIVICEFSSIGTRVKTRAAYFEITRKTELKDYIDFDLIDGSGFDWRGKISRPNESASLEVELFRKDSPHRWVNFGKEGKKFLKENNISHLYLGL